MNISLKITACLLARAMTDLIRPHPFAFERVGFFLCRPGPAEPDGWVLLGWDYQVVDDDDYVDDPTVGAMFGAGAIRKALQAAYNEPFSIIHVHLHDHAGTPGFSYIDARESARYVPDFWNVRPNLPHGAVVLSRDSACGYVWEPKVQKRLPLQSISIVGAPLRVIRNGHE